MKFTVTLDGPAAAGKGTIAKRVAAEFGFAHLDSGLLYRAVGRRMLAGEDPVAAARALDPEDMARDDLRTPDVAKAASEVAVIADVRAALVEFQRGFAQLDGGTVIDGRDIGTVICPEAQVKIFVTASPEERARRRFAELSAKGHRTSLAEVLADVEARDRRDREREASPLKPAPEALLLDTTELDIDAATAAALAFIRRALPEGHPKG